MTDKTKSYSVESLIQEINKKLNQEYKIFSQVHKSEKKEISKVDLVFSSSNSFDLFYEKGSESLRWRNSEERTAKQIEKQIIIESRGKIASRKTISERVEIKNEKSVMVAQQVKWPKKITKWNEGLNLKSFLISIRDDAEFQKMIDVLSDIILTKNIIKTSDSFDKLSENGKVKNLKFNLKSLTAKFIELGLEVSCCGNHVRLPDHIYNNNETYKLLKKTFTKLKGLDKNNSELTQKTKMIKELWFNDEVDEKLEKVYHFRESPPCECFVDDSKKAIFIGYCESKESKNEKNYGICLGYFNSGLSMVLTNR
jgi:hypothetical protein